MEFVENLRKKQNFETLVARTVLARQLSTAQTLTPRREFALANRDDDADAWTSEIARSLWADIPPEQAPVREASIAQLPEATLLEVQLESQSA